MPKSRTLYKEGNKFNGSKGSGETNVPSTAPSEASAVKSAGSGRVSGRKPTLGTVCTRYTDTVIEGARQRCTNTVAGGGDWCGECPGYKKPKAPSAGAAKTSHAVDGAIKAEEVNRCQGSVTAHEGEARQCKRAVRAPETMCFDHGGDPEASLGKTFAKAQAEAGRGELIPPTADERRSDPDYLRAMMERDLQKLVTTDPQAFLDMAGRMAQYDKEHSMSRFSTGNQMMVLCWAYHLEKERNPELSDKDLLNRAFRRCEQPLHTRAGWGKMGRDLLENATPIPVLYYSPGGVFEDIEVDEVTGEETKTSRYSGPRFGAKLQFFADETEGEDLPTRPSDPLERPLPPGHGDPVAYREWLAGHASNAGVDIVVDKDAPKSGAKAYYSPTEKRIHLWAGHAGGDLATQAHVLAHELGHALDPKLDHAAYGSSGCNERGRAEVFAETFAFLLTARHGFNSADSSSGYAAGWAKGLGGLGSHEAATVMRDALTVAHELLYPIEK